jgi:hypothetical protein
MSELLGTVMSSRKLKHDIVQLKGALDRITQLRGVTFKWNHDSSDSSGVIAEEVREIIPEATKLRSGILCIEPLPLIGHLIEAVKELRHEINLLKKAGA